MEDRCQGRENWVLLPGLLSDFCHSDPKSPSPLWFTPPPLQRHSTGQMERVCKFCIHLVRGDPKGCLSPRAFKTDHKESRPRAPSVWGREQMASRLPRSSLETGSVWTQLTDDRMGGWLPGAVPKELLSSGYPTQRLEDAGRLLAWKWGWNYCQDEEQKLEREEEKIS